MCRDEFKLSKIKPSGEKARHCAQSPWFPWPVVLAYRLVLAAYCTGWLIYSGFHHSNGKTKWFIFLTNWGYLTLTLYFIYAAAVTLWYHVREKKTSDGGMEMKFDGEAWSPTEANAVAIYSSLMKCHHQLMWLMFNVIANVAIIISILYWSFIFPFVGKTSGLDISNHLLNTIFVLLELMLSSIPIRILHFIYPFIFAICYLIFTVIYWAAGGTNAKNNPYIYQYVDYDKNPEKAVGIILGTALVLLPILQCAFFGLYKLRCYIAKKCGRVSPDNVN